MLCEQIAEAGLRSLLRQYLKRAVCDRGLCSHPERGRPLGGPLSPLLGALYLKPLDDVLDKAEGAYARFIDDWCYVVPTRWKLKRAVRAANQVLASLGLEKAHAKTFLGPVDRGFTFLGYYIQPSGIRVAPQTLENFARKLVRLSEQGASPERIGQYVRHWTIWARSGLGGEPGGCDSKGSSGAGISLGALSSDGDSRGPLPGELCLLAVAHRP